MNLQETVKLLLTWFQKQAYMLIQKYDVVGLNPI